MSNPEEEIQSEEIDKYHSAPETTLNPFGGIEDERRKKLTGRRTPASLELDTDNRRVGDKDPLSSTAENAFDQLVPFSRHSVFLVLMYFIGGSSPMLAIFFFTKGKSEGFFSAMSLLAACSFTAVSTLGFYWHMRWVLRTKPPVNVEKAFVGIVALVSFIVGVSFGTTTDDIWGFIFTAIAVFCCAMIVQPTYDFGIVCLFACLPLSTALGVLYTLLCAPAVSSLGDADLSSPLRRLF